MEVASLNPWARVRRPPCFGSFYFHRLACRRRTWMQTLRAFHLVHVDCPQMGCRRPCPCRRIRRLHLPSLRTSCEQRSSASLSRRVQKHIRTHLAKMSFGSEGLKPPGPPELKLKLAPPGPPNPPAPPGKPPKPAPPAPGGGAPPPLRPSSPN